MHSQTEQTDQSLNQAVTAELVRLREIERLYNAGLESWRPVYKSVLDDRDRIRREAIATVASILTRIGQIEKACKAWTADSIYQIEHATTNLRQTAKDLERTVQPQAQGEKK